MRSFKKAQQQFVCYLRNGDGQQIEEDKVAGWQLYHRLVYENNRALIESSFPVSRSFLPASAWQQLIQDFLMYERSPTPYFHQVGQIFLEFLAARIDLWKPVCPFLTELMHFEFAEMSLAIAANELPFKNEQELSFNDTRLSISALAWPLLYEYPVHKILNSGETLPASEFPVCLLLWRSKDYVVNRCELAPLAFAVVEMLQSEKGITGEKVLQNLYKKLPHLEMDYLQQQGRAILQYLWAKEIIGDMSDN